MSNVSIFSLLKDSKTKGLLIFLGSLTLLVFSFIKVPFLTTIHSYTVGLMLGRFSPFFYAYYIYIGALIFTNYKFEMPKWKSMTKYSYWFLVLSIAFVATTFASSNYKVVGYKAFNEFTEWFNEFTDSSGKWYLPKDTIGGVLGVFMYSVVSMVLSGIGSIIVSISLIIAAGSMLLTGTAFGLYINLIGNAKKARFKSVREQLNEKVTAEETKEMQKNVENLLPEVDENSDEIEDVFDLPFDDPFE